MRVEVSAEHRQNPIPHLKDYYAREIVESAMNFSKITYQRSILSLREFEGARARTAEINGCKLCRSFRAVRDVPAYLEAVGAVPSQSIVSRGPAPDEAFYANVSRWKDYPGFSERERVAIAYAEGLGLDPQGIAANEAFWRRAKAAFSDEEIVDLSYCIACWIGLGRITHTLGLDGVCSFVPAEKVA
jgi:alkylhydroperoxidase family enzyme